MKRSKIRDGLKWEIERFMFKGHRLKEAVTLGELIDILQGAGFLDFGDERHFEKLDELLDQDKIYQKKLKREKEGSEV